MRVNQSVDILTDSRNRDLLLSRFRNHLIPYELLIRDIEDAVEESNQVQSNRQSLDGRRYDEFYRRYPTFSQIESRLGLMARVPQSRLSLIGLSYEGRNISLLRYSTDPSIEKPVILIDGGHHAREVSSTEEESKDVVRDNDINTSSR